MTRGNFLRISSELSVPPPKPMNNLLIGISLYHEYKFDSKSAFVLIIGTITSTPSSFAKVFLSINSFFE